MTFSSAVVATMTLLWMNSKGLQSFYSAFVGIGGMFKRFLIVSVFCLKASLE